MKELLKCPVYVDQCTLLVHKDVAFCHDKSNWNLSPYTQTEDWRGAVNERQVQVRRSWIPSFNHFCCSDCVWLCDKEWCEILQIWHTNCEMYGFPLINWHKYTPWNYWKTSTRGNLKLFLKDNASVDSGHQMSNLFWTVTLLLDSSKSTYNRLWWI